MPNGDAVCRGTLLFCGCSMHGMLLFDSMSLSLIVMQFLLVCS